MEIIRINTGGLYIDKPLFDYINHIWVTFDQKIPNDKNIFFLKNTSIPRLITDYTGTGISRVIKKEKADYCIIDKFDIPDYLVYYDRTNNCLIQDDNFEPVYSLSGLHPETIATIEQIKWFADNSLNIEYINQNILNSSLNNGFVIDNENYSIIQELIESKNQDNLKIAYNMISNSDLEQNLDWILYLYHNKRTYLDQFERSNGDKIGKYYQSNNQLNLGHYLDEFDKTFLLVKNPIVTEKLMLLKKWEFRNKINEFITSKLDTELFRLGDFDLILN